MPLITHVFKSHQRIQNGRVVATDNFLPRRANFEYDSTGNNVVISIIPTLSPKTSAAILLK